MGSGKEGVGQGRPIRPDLLGDVRTGKHIARSGSAAIPSIRVLRFLTVVRPNSYIGSG